jgi:hypothetical protein
MPSTLTPALIRQHVRAIQTKLPGAHIIGIQASDTWTGPSTMDVDGREVDVVSAISPLHVRELMADRAESARPLVVLTGLSPHDLGLDVLSRLAGRQLMTPDPWALVIDAFKARDLDPRLLKHRWMATSLLDAMPPAGYPPVAAGVLDSETAWSLVLEGRLGLRVSRPDPPALLEWLSGPGNTDRLQALPDEISAGVRTWIAESAGPAGLAMLDAARLVPPADLVALGLVCASLFSGDEGRPHPETREAVIRFEPFIGGRSLTSRDGAAWAEAALALVRQRGRDERKVRAWLDRADVLLGDLGAVAAAWRNEVSPRGFEQRCERCARAIDATLSTPSEASFARASLELQLVRDHTLARTETQRDRVDRLAMALRLARWLASDRGRPAAFATAARQYLADDAFADLARTVLKDGDPSATVSAVTRRVQAATRERREAHETQFAELFAGWLDAGATSRLLLTERVLTEIVAHASHAAPVLLLVLDGMSASTFYELAESAQEDGWLPITAVERSMPEMVVTPLPSVTEYCRASLFAGRLARGGATDEASAFTAHPELLAESRPAKPPILFHKAALGESGGALSATVRAEIESVDRRVIAMVINAVDDHLLKADQVRSRWTLPNVPVLRTALHAARVGRRLVILTSDHGHVLETGSTAMEGGEADRWRPAESGVRPGERLFRGPRVLTATHECIAAVSEGVRYRSRKNGYHGGATAQEAIVPLAAFIAATEPVPDGWREVGVQRPSWWEPAAAAPATVRAIAGVASVAPPPAATTSTAPPPLLRIAEMEPALPPQTSLVDQLLPSPVFRAQRSQHARISLDDARVRAFLEYLLGRGGRSTRTALAAQLGLPLFRIGGHLTALRTLLNVDGYAVLAIDDATDTVELNVELLRRQFEL